MEDVQNTAAAREAILRESDRLFLSLLRANAQGADELRRRLAPVTGEGEAAGRDARLG